MHFRNSDETCQYVRSQTDQVLLGWSAGRDSILAWLQLRKFWTAEQIIPIHQIHIPGPPPTGRGTLAYLERILADQEQRIGRRIYRIPHVSFYTTLAGKTYQPPERFAALEDLNEQGFLPLLDYYEYTDWIKEQTGLDHAWSATGIRAADNIYRRRHITSHGSVLPERMHFYPVWDVTKLQAEHRLRAAKFPLSVEYRWFGRSLCGMDARFSWQLKDCAPQDYETLKFWYPLADLDIFRLHCRAELLKQHTLPVRKAKIMPDPDDRFLGLEDIERNLQDGIQEIAEALAGHTTKSAQTTMFDNMDTRFWCALVFQSEAAKTEFLEKLRLHKLGNKYLCGEEVARLFGIELSTPMPGMPNWRIDPLWRDMAQEE